MATSVIESRLQHEQRAVEVVARVFAGDRKLRLAPPSARSDAALDRRLRPRRRLRAGVGKSSRGSVGIRDSNRSADTLTPVPPFSVSMLTSASGSARTISYSFFAGSVTAPGLSTAASQRLRSATSRSVASSVISLPVGFDQHVRQDRESCSCARRSAGRIAVPAQDRLSWRPVPCEADLDGGLRPSTELSRGKGEDNKVYRKRCCLGNFCANKSFFINYLTVHFSVVQMWTARVRRIGGFRPIHSRPQLMQPELWKLWTLT